MGFWRVSVRFDRERKKKKKKKESRTIQKKKKNPHHKKGVVVVDSHKLRESGKGGKPGRIRKKPVGPQRLPSQGPSHPVKCQKRERTT